jgi:glycerol-3-phosphate acyltransferase PlsY
VFDSNSLMYSWRLIALAYLIGSIPFAVIVSRAMGLADPRSFGSKNPGATNVLRSGSKLAAVLVLLGDAGKGWLALYVARELGGPASPEWAFAGAAVAVFLGHVFPVFLKFKGGKGVATALGIMFGLSVWLGLATIATWLIVAVIFRYSSLAALVAALFAPFYYALGTGVAGSTKPLVILALAFIVLTLFWRHRANISRLRAGTEPRIGASKKTA